MIRKWELFNYSLADDHIMYIQAPEADMFKLVEELNQRYDLTLDFDKSTARERNYREFSARMRQGRTT